MLFDLLSDLEAGVFGELVVGVLRRPGRTGTTVSVLKQQHQMVDGSVGPQALHTGKKRFVDWIMVVGRQSLTSSSMDRGLVRFGNQGCSSFGAWSHRR